MSVTERDLEEGPQEAFYLGDDDDALRVETFYQWESCAGVERESPRLEWLVERLVPLGGVVVLWGMSGTLKSFVVQSLAGAVARGTDWAGRPVRQGPVLYIAAEGGHGLGVRLRGYRHDLGLTEPLPENWRWMREPVRLANPHAVTALARDIEATRKAFGDRRANVLVVFDTLGAGLAGDADENVPKDMQRVMESMRRITATNATVIVIHHSDKEGRRDRGHASLRNRADVMIKATAKGRRVTLTFDKRRDGGATGDQLVLDAEQVVLSDGESTLALRLASGTPAAQTEHRSTYAKKGNGTRQTLLASLENFGAAGATSSQWQGASGMSHGTYNRHRRDLVQKKEVIQRGKHYIVAQAAA